MGMLLIVYGFHKILEMWWFGSLKRGGFRGGGGDWGGAIVHENVSSPKIHR